MRAYHHWRLLGGRLRGRANRWTGVRVLCYHRLAEADEDLSVSPLAFRRHMEMVLESGAEPVRLAQALELARREPSRRYVCMTFDDGYRDNVEQGEPVLRDLGIPATIFLPTAVIDGRVTYFWYERPPPALGWDEIEQATRRGVIDFQSHTDTHAWLPELSDQQALREFTESKALIEHHTGSAVTSIAFPGGLYGPRELQLVRQAGYQAGLTTDPGVNTGGQDPAALKRTLIYRADSPADFEAKMSGLLDGPARLRNLLLARFGTAHRNRGSP